MNERPKIGAIGWFDLTVDDAEQVRDFYKEVVGWRHQDISMGDYSDYAMLRPEDGEGVAGVCHNRGSNQGLPPQWLIYVTVADLAHSLARCEALGGEVVQPRRDMGAYGAMAVVRDPAGACMALMEPPAPE